MDMEAFENPWMKKIRFLTKLLLVSVAFNIGLATSVFYMRSEKKNDRELRVKKVVLEKTNAEVLAHYFKNSFKELVRELKDKTVLQDGYTKRDLALACLVNYHYLNVEKAISGKPLQRRKLTFVHQDGGEGFQVEVFPNLDDLDFSLIEKFIREEKFPFSMEGLFIDLKRQGSEKDPVLEKAFFAAFEFTLLHTGLKRLHESLAKEELLDCLLEGNFEELQKWVNQTKLGSSFLDGMRDFFSQSLKKGASQSLSLWVALDSDYIQRKFTDLELHGLIQHLKENTVPVNIFLKQILCSVRSDEVRKEAALKLYQFEKIVPKEPYDHEEALKRFLPMMFVKKEAPKQESASYTPLQKKHTVSEGESLWKISRKYKISIEEIREYNHLKSDKLKPGQELFLPS
ncbi:MAG: LysM peptidoglycan-binding domain-containing protein [Chlamydiae bacterium]|nr:LysM peptidoglycan-binding domain-containing protein [Chlamydiota bacterium]